MIVIGVFVFVLFIVLIVMVIILFKNRNSVVNRWDWEELFLIKLVFYDYVCFNWINIYVIVFEVVEFF